MMSRSSTKAEYKALVNVTTEIMWVQKLLDQLQVPHIAKAYLRCDNLGATYLSSNLHARTIFMLEQRILKLTIVL